MVSGKSLFSMLSSAIYTFDSFCYLPLQLVPKSSGAS